MDERTAEAKKPSFACPQCNRNLNSDADLKRHVRFHVRSHPCDACNRKFTCEYDLKRHLRAQHSAEDANDDAGANAADPNLKTYLRVEPYRCDVCDQTVPRGFQMVRHMRAHEEERQKTTGKRVRQQQEQKTSRRREPPSLFCDVCNRGFNRKACLQRHSLVHTGERQCVLCTGRFPTGNALKSHSGEHPFSCEDCGKKFATRSGLRLHARGSICKKEAS